MSDHNPDLFDFIFMVLLLSFMLKILVFNDIDIIICFIHIAGYVYNYIILIITF